MNSPRYLAVPCLGLPRGLGRARQPQMACLGLPRVLGEISEKIPNQVFSNSRKYFVTNIFGGHDDLTQCRYMSVRPSVRPSVPGTGVVHWSCGLCAPSHLPGGHT